MKGRQNWDVFISYSRADRGRVRPLVDLLRAAGVIAFRDEDCIQPGRPWEAALDQSISASKTVFVFWSQNSADSKAVQREYRKAIMQKKTVVPVLLDDTRLPPSLRRYQWLDLRALMVLGSNRTAAALAATGGPSPVPGGLHGFLTHRIFPEDFRRLEIPPVILELTNLPPTFSEGERATLLDAIRSRLTAGR